MITLAELFAAQSTLTVDEPEGEYTIGSPANLFNHFKTLQLEVNAQERQNGTRDISIRYADNSKAVISIAGNGSIRVAHNYDIGPDGPTRPQPQYDEDWGLIDKETQQGVEYHAYANALYTAATQDFQELARTNYAGLADSIHFIIKMEFGEIDWPETPYGKWSEQDRAELMKMAVEGWDYAPGQEVDEHLFLKDFKSRRLNHLGNETA